MITFDQKYYAKFQDFSLNGTGYLAYRDIKKIIDLHNINLDKVLDLGCASGRSTNFLLNLTESIYACDVSKYTIDIVKKNITKNVFLNDSNKKSYKFFPYSSIFSFFTFLHLTSNEEISSEFLRCKNSLINSGYLVIVTGHKNLFFKNYSSVACMGDKPIEDGTMVKIKLKKLGCEVDNCFWEYLTLIKLAEKQGLSLSGTYFPVGKKNDNKEYIDEYDYPPYICLVFKK